MQHNTARYLLIVRGVHHYLHAKESLKIIIALSETVNRRTTNTIIEGKKANNDTIENDRD
jgi:hypothetical protein